MYIFRKSNYSYLVLIIYLFIAIFAPPVLKNINLILPIFIYACYAIFFKYSKQALAILSNKYMKRFIYWYFAYIGYLTFLILCALFLNEQVAFAHYVKNYYSLFLYLPVTFVCALYAVLRAKTLHITSTRFVGAIVLSGVLQAFLALLSVLNPAIKHFFIRNMYLNTGDQLLATPWITDRRFYGFANNLLDLFGLGMGIIAICALALATIRPRYLWAFVIVVTAGAINSRTTILVATIGLLAYGHKYLRAKIRSCSVGRIGIISFVVALVMLVLGLQTLSKFAPATMDWVKSDITSFICTDNCNKENTGSKLFSNSFWQLPSSPLLLITGTGHTLYGVEGMAHSDVGFINDIWRTGIIGIVILYLPLIYLFIDSYRNTTHAILKMLLKLNLIILFIFLIKGTIWGYSSATMVAFLILLYSRTGLDGYQRQANG